MKHLLYFRESNSEFEESKRKVSEMSEDDKMKVWLDYMITQTALNNYQSIHKAPDNIDFDKFKTKFNSVTGAYPTLRYVTSDAGFNIPVKPFDEFCKVLNNDPNNLYGWYWRFKKRIFN